MTPYTMPQHEGTVSSSGAPPLPRQSDRGTIPSVLAGQQSWASHWEKGRATYLMIQHWSRLLRFMLK